MAAANDDSRVTFEDQKNINKFARLNARLNDLKEELIEKEKEFESLKCAEEEFLMIEVDGNRIPYQIGETLVEMTLEEAQAKLAIAKETCQAQILDLMQKAETYKQSLSELKTALCGRFGANISLVLDYEN